MAKTISKNVVKKRLQWLCYFRDKIAKEIANIDKRIALIEKRIEKESWES